MSPSWEAASPAATQEFLNILWKVHYRVHKSPPLVSVHSKINQGHTILTYLAKIHFNIIHTLIEVSEISTAKNDHVTSLSRTPVLFLLSVESLFK
jgi:hypothetical protein